MDLPVRATFVATNLNAAEAVYFAPETHPDVSLSFAVRASMAVPVKAFVWLLISAMEWETERGGDMYPNKRVSRNT
jgi:hypothetical protein